MIQKEEGLKRTVGVLGLSANIMNIIIGAGIFALPAIVASKMGSSSIIAYLFCGVLIALITLCFAEAGSKVTNTGGPYAYIQRAFGDYAGFIGGIFTVAGTLIADAAVSNVLVDILGSMYPVFQTQWVKLLFLFIIFFGLATTNVFGIKQGIGLVKFNTLAKLIPLLLLVVFGWKEVDFINLHIESAPSFKQLGETALILFFAFQGCETALIAGGEIKNPNRTIPKAIFISILSVVILYALIQTVCQGVLGAELPSFTATPLAETAKVVFGSIGFAILIIGSCISMFGYLSGSILNNPRLIYALGRDQIIPIKALSKIHKSFATPYISIITYAVLGFIIAISGSFQTLAIIASSAMLIVYFGVTISVIKLRYSQKTQPDEFEIPGGLIVPILAMGIIIYFLSNIGKNEAIATLVFIAVISVIFLLMKAFRKKKH